MAFDRRISQGTISEANSSLKTYERRTKKQQDTHIESAQVTKLAASTLSEIGNRSLLERSPEHLKKILTEIEGNADFKEKMHKAYEKSQISKTPAVIGLTQSIKKLQEDLSATEGTEESKIQSLNLFLTNLAIVLPFANNKPLRQLCNITEDILANLKQ